MVAYNLAKVDARVRFPLPAPGQLHRNEGYFVNFGVNLLERAVSLSDFYSVFVFDLSLLIAD